MEQEIYTTKEDLQSLRADLTKIIGDVETKLVGSIASAEQRMIERIASTDQRIARLDGQFMIIIRLNYFMAASLLAMAVKVIFFPS